MRPTKLLTISALAGLSLISYGTSAHAAPVSAKLTGSVTSSCTLKVTDGSLYEDTVPEVVLVANGANSGIVVVTCNDSAKSLNLAINTGTSAINNGTGKIRFVGAAGVLGGVFAGITKPNTPLPAAIVVPIANPTKQFGDTAYIQVRIDAPTGKLLKAGSYNLVVDATITP